MEVIMDGPRLSIQNASFWSDGKTGRVYEELNEFGSADPYEED